MESSDERAFQCIMNVQSAPTKKDVGGSPSVSQYGGSLSCNPGNNAVPQEGSCLKMSPTIATRSPVLQTRVAVPNIVTRFVTSSSEVSSGKLLGSVATSPRFAPLGGSLSAGSAKQDPSVRTSSPMRGLPGPPRTNGVRKAFPSPRRFESKVVDVAVVSTTTSASAECPGADSHVQAEGKLVAVREQTDCCRGKGTSVADDATIQAVLDTVQGVLHALRQESFARSRDLAEMESKMQSQREWFKDELARCTNDVCSSQAMADTLKDFEVRFELLEAKIEGTRGQFIEEAERILQEHTQAAAQFQFNVQRLSKEVEVVSHAVRIESELRAKADDNLYVKIGREFSSCAARADEITKVLHDAIAKDDEDVHALYDIVFEALDNTVKVKKEVQEVRDKHEKRHERSRARMFLLERKAQFVECAARSTPRTSQLSVIAEQEEPSPTAAGLSGVIAEHEDPFLNGVGQSDAQNS